MSFGGPRGKFSRSLRRRLRLRADIGLGEFFEISPCLRDVSLRLPILAPKEVGAGVRTREAKCAVTVSDAEVELATVKENSRPGEVSHAQCGVEADSLSAVTEGLVLFPLFRISQSPDQVCVSALAI